ncbi:MAG: hypothetical protein ACFBWO_03775 [Paracoccaceae bacterium]
MGRSRTVGFVAVAGFVLLSPAVYQLFGYHTIWLRPWVMYSGVGVGVLDGEFVVRTDGEATRRLTPLEAFGLDRYPLSYYYRFEQRVDGPETIGELAAPTCKQLSPGEALSFEGAVGTRRGWAPLAVRDVCAETRHGTAGHDSAETASLD